MEEKREINGMYVYNHKYTFSSASFILHGVKILLLVISILLLTTPTTVEAHGYLASPRSRNFVAYEDGKWFGGDNTTPFPEPEPQSANIGGVRAVCGIIAATRNYDIPANVLGSPLVGIKPQAYYQCGQVIDLSVVLTAHHKGHFEFKACAISQLGQIPTQACFDANPLTFISDTKFGAPPDPFYPSRAYIPLATAGTVGTSGTWKYEYRYKLPSNLSGDHVVLQWHYITANSCMHVGYDTYNWPVGSTWPIHPSLDAGRVPRCGPLPADGQGVPEQFWNCADIRIATNCANNPPPPPSPPTSNPPPTRAPVNPSTPTVIPPTPPSSPSTCPANKGSCGPNMSCPVGLCCSQWGYCGIDEYYCGTCCQNGPCFNKTTTPPSPSSKPTMFLPTSSKPRTSIPSKLSSVKPTTKPSITRKPTSSKPKTIYSNN